MTDDELRRQVAAELSWDPQVDSEVIDVSAVERGKGVSDAGGAQRGVQLGDFRRRHSLIFLAHLDRQPAESPQIVPVPRDHVVRRIRQPSAEHRIDNARVSVDRDERQVDEERRPRRVGRQSGQLGLLLACSRRVHP